MDLPSVISIAAAHLEKNSEALVAEWIEWVRGRVGTSTVGALPERALRNHIPPVLLSLASYIRNPVELAREELLGHLRLHGQIRRDQGYSLEEVLAEFDGLAELVTTALNEHLGQEAASAPPDVILEVATRLSAGLRAVSFIAMGTYSRADQEREQEMSSSLEEFARAISHELRNPLNTLALSVKLLQSGEADEDEMPAYLGVMEAAVRRATQLLDTVRTLAVAESARSGGRLVLLADALGRIRRDFEDEARAAGIQIEVDPHLPDVRVEAVLLYIAAANVLGNAIKYADPNKNERWARVTAQVFEEEGDSGFCDVSVQDNGIGIPEDLRSRIFQRGFRAHPEHAQGTGLGLHIVQQAVGSRGGTVDLETEEGAGTTLTFRLRCLSGTEGMSPGRFRVARLLGENAILELSDRARVGSPDDEVESDP